MSKKLLLADDSVVIQKLVGLSFANENVEIVYADNGDDAIARAKEVTPDVVLADVVMPGKSGYEVCEAVKQDPALAHVPVLLLTGTFEAFDEARAQTAGADGQITKPFEAQALVSRITEVMENPPAAQTTAAAVGAAANADGLLEAEPVSDAAFFDSAVDGDADRPAQSTVESAEVLETISVADDQSLGLDVSGSGAMADTPLIRTEKVRPEQEIRPDPAIRVDEPVGSEPLSLEPINEVSAADLLEAADQPPALPPAYLSPPPLSPSPPPLSDERSPQNADEAVSDLQRELTPSAAAEAELEAISSLEVGEALASGMPDGDATIFVAEEDRNAQTTRNWNAAEAAPTAEDGDLDALTLHAPSAPIDHSQATGDSPRDAFGDSSPQVLYGRRSNDVAMDQALNETVVTDLDARLASSSLGAGLAGAGQPGASQDDPATASPEVSSVFGPPDQSFSATSPAGAHGGAPPIGSPFGDEPVEALDTTDSEFLDIGPAGHGAEDLDFGFDVSEQQDVLEAADPLDQSFSALMDASESQILGSPVRPDPLMADYDVSASDLSETLPPSRSAQAVPGEDTISRGVEDALRSSFSAPAVSSASGVSDASEQAATEAPSAPSAEGRFGTPLDLDPVSGPAAIPVDADAAPGEAVARPAVSSEERVPDLSPMMEQRVQEVLEKVAWEAFSDLSESIVKQVMERVERIAWDVVPQMAETLVREEIRLMKDGENADD